MTKALDLSDIQGNIIRGYGRFGFPMARYFFLRIDNGEQARSFIDKVIKYVTTSMRWGSDSPDKISKPKVTTNIAFSFSGLRALDLPMASLIGFPQEFIMGMKKRKDILGDDGSSAPENWDKIWNEEVHVWLSINGMSLDVIEDRYQALMKLVEKKASGVTLLTGHRGDDGELDLPYQDASVLYEKGKPIGKEHFGYTDGIGDPVFEGETDNPTRVIGRGKIGNNGEWTPLATGEFILGHPDEAQEYPHAPLPVVLSRNGTFMVYRKLHENVGSFNRFLNEHSKNYPVEEESPEMKKELLAAKFSGRWRDNGAPVVKAPSVKSKAEWDQRYNEASDAEKHRMLTDFTFDDDIEGGKCPLSAHIRRINPRGSLDFGNKDAYETPTALVNRRRILRRGLPYGRAKNPRSNKGNHGIIFMALNASIERQFEFVQQQWINYGNDFKQSNDKDVLLGNHSPTCPSKMVIPADPNPKQFEGGPPYFIKDIPRLVETRGGEYFFIPSITALRMIAEGIIDPT